MATESQVEFARSLCEELGRPFDEDRARRVSVKDMSGYLSRLLARVKIRQALDRVQQELFVAENPKGTAGHPLSAANARAYALPQVPAGRYAVSLAAGAIKFYKVDRPAEGKWAGRTFLSVQASDEFWAVRDRDKSREVLRVIAEDPAAASKLYGTELGSCGVCGRTLTDPDSIAAGIGPICASRTGW